MPSAMSLLILQTGQVILELLIIWPRMRNAFIILVLTKDRVTKQVLAKETCADGLYVLKDGLRAFVADVSNKASFELWHACLGHISFDMISV
ncbi:hypothetical protein HanIR_Chr10g0465411 [Helianthus annuus]|nr:hypothetical protein HanIR_Chr10g0465411 [Helianthus annuus]